MEERGSAEVQERTSSIGARAGAWMKNLVVKLGGEGVMVGLV